MSTNTLTERYVHEVVRRIPAGQRDDIADELRTTIADTVDAGDPADPASAERRVLTEMGDPIRLAARYSGRPLALIGPELYPSYLRLLVLLLSTVLPVITVASVVVDVLDHRGAGAVIGTGIGTLIIVGGQMIAWLTVVFALVERFQRRDGRTPGAATWTPDDLPAPRQPDKPAGAFAAAVGNALLIGLIVWQHTAQPYRADGAGRMEVLNPDLWSGWMWPMLAGLTGLVAVELVRIATRGWTVRLAIAHCLAEALFTLPLAWVLSRHTFFNPEFLTAVNGADWTTPDEFYTATALIVLAVAISGAVRRFRAASQSPGLRPSPGARA